MTAAAGRCDGQVLGVGTGQPSKEFHKHIVGRAQLCWPSILDFKRSLRGQKMFQPKLGYARNPAGETGSVVGEKSLDIYPAFRRHDFYRLQRLAWRRACCCISVRPRGDESFRRTATFDERICA